MTRSLGHIQRLASVHPLAELALGILASLERLDDLLANFAPPGHAAAGSRGEATTIYFVLGLIAMRDRIRSGVEECGSSLPDIVHEGEANDSFDGGLLR